VNTVFEIRDNYTCEDLLEIMRILRGENGCPWDREQDHKSIRNDFLEEVYEVIDAIDNDDVDGLKEELGDVLLQVVFHSQIETEKLSFDFDEVCDGICKKLILRHPHVFGDVEAKTSAKVKENWDAIKKVEKGQTTATETLRSVPKAFPALMRSKKVQSRAAKAGMDFRAIEDVVKSLESELKELKEAMRSGSKAACEEELGDLLFSVVNISRFLKVDAEESLAKSCDKFIDRFEKSEQLAEEKGIEMKKATVSELDILWDEAKKRI